MNALIVINIVVLIILLILTIYTFFKSTSIEVNEKNIIKNQQEGFDKLYEDILKTSADTSKQLGVSFESQTKLINSYNEKVVSEVKGIADMQKERLEIVDKTLDKMTKSNEASMDKINNNVEKRLDQILSNNDKKLDDMRKTVDEKLDEGLEKRFKESFKFMNEQFDQVSGKLGEMKTIANSVSDFKRILTNVKTRGTFGEIQLENMLSQMLSSTQYKKNVQIRENDSKRVDYAILLPGDSEGKEVYLPIDSKFPVESYNSLLEAIENNQEKQIEKSRKAIERKVRDDAKSISEKYINPPMTTSFAIMYIATEGLYSEILKNTELMGKLQNEYRIIVSGPTTFSAMLNSLQLGFKTLTMQKYSKEIWEALESFKTEFNTFTGLLSKTQKKVGEVSNTIDDATRRTKIIQKKLDSVANITGQDNEKLPRSSKTDD